MNHLRPRGGISEHEANNCSAEKTPDGKVPGSREKIRKVFARNDTAQRVFPSSGDRGPFDDICTAPGHQIIPNKEYEFHKFSPSPFICGGGFLFEGLPQGIHVTVSR